LTSAVVQYWFNLRVIFKSATVYPGFNGDKCF